MQLGSLRMSHVRRQRQDDGYQYNDTNHIAQKQWMIKVPEHLWVLILPKIFLLVSMKALD
jgi:hypothetical protein